MAFDLCVIPVSTVPYLSALQTRQFSVKDITAHLVSGKLTRDQCRLMTPENFASSYGSSSYALYVRRSSVSSEINLAITSSASESDNAPTGYTIVVQGYLNEQNSQIVLGVCVSDEPIVADASLRLFVNIEETNNVFRLSADFDGMVTQGLLDDLLERYVTTDTKQTITSTKTLRSGEFRTNFNISNITVENVPSSTSDHVSTATLASDGIHADGVSFKNDYGRAADNYLVASVSGNSGYSELTSLGGRGFKFCYKGADETEYHYPLRLEAGITMFDENQTLHLAKDTNTYLHVDDDTLSVKDYVERIAGSSVSDDDYSKIFAGVWDYNTVESNTPTLSGSPLSSDSDNVLVVLSKSSSKLVPLLVPGPCAGDVMVNTQFDWESPIYALFEGFRCFSAHPMVDFSQILGSHSGVNDPVFISDYEDLYETNKRFCVGIPYDVNIPSSCIHWRLLGYTTSTPGYIRLTESHPFLKDFIYQTGGYVKLSDFTVMFYDDYYGSVNSSQYVDYLRTNGISLDYAVNELIHNYGNTVFHIKDLDPSSVDATEMDGEVYVSLPSMTTVEFEDRMSFRTSAGEAAYIDSDGVYHGDATGISSAPTLSFSGATSGTSGGNLRVSVGGKTSSLTPISPVRRAYEAVSAETATALETARTVDGMLFDGSDNIVHYGTCTTEAETKAKVVSLSYFTLATGARIAVKFTYSNAVASPTLNVSGTGAKPIRRYGSNSVGTTKYLSWLANSIVEFVYDGSNWVWVGFQYNTYQAYQAETATKATQDGFGNTITSYYCTLSTDQEVSGSKTFSGLSEFTGDTYITGYGSGGLRFADDNSLQTTDYVKVRGNCSSSSYSGIDFMFYVNSVNRAKFDLKCNSSGQLSSVALSNILSSSVTGSLYLIYFQAVSKKTSGWDSYERGSILQSTSTCTISGVSEVTVSNVSGSSTSVTPSSGYCLTMCSNSTISNGANGVFRLLNRVSIPASSTRYCLALVVRIA